MKQKVTQVVLNTSEFRGEAPPSNLVEFRGWVNKLLHEIPAAYLFEAQIAISAKECLGDYGVYYEVFYLRDETDEEESKREGVEAVRQTVVEIRELAEFKRLQEKYGSHS